MNPIISEEQKEILVANFIAKATKIRKLIQEIGLHHIIEPDDKYGIFPKIRCEDLYNIVMDVEKCDDFINKLREYRMKAFK